MAGATGTDLAEAPAGTEPQDFRGPRFSGVRELGGGTGQGHVAALVGLPAVELFLAQPH